MCLAVPLKVVSVEGHCARCEAGGMTREVRVDFLPDVKVGEYVMVHAGFAIERVDEAQAVLDREAWEEMENALR